jgi:hypothetical protein
MPYRNTSLDFYDDGGAYLKRAAPEYDDIPDFVKTASPVSQADHPNRFALVLVEDGQALKKFATVDAGNTWLSALYFMKNHGKLPEEAQKIAAGNLLLACEAYGIEPPSTILDLADEAPETNVVDVTGQRPGVRPAEVLKKEDVHYAVERADGSKTYPLDNAEQVKAAMDYFDRHVGQFTPRERREFAVKTAAAAEKAGMPLRGTISSYIGEQFSPALVGHLSVRGHFLLEQGDTVHVEELRKLAAAQREMDPADFAARLEEIDRESGMDRLWDRGVADPWYATFGLQKTAKGDRESPASFQVGDAWVTEDELRSFATQQTVKAYFGEKLATEFLKDPLGVFQSLPLPQRKLVARLASSASTTTV